MDYYHGSELDAGGELSLAKETNPMQMKQKDWKMTNRSQDSKEAAVILPKRNMKSSTERRCESWARKTLRLYVSICMCLRKSSSYEDPIPPAKLRALRI